jgi:transcriptional regulator with XRE-family HTH domain
MPSDRETKLRQQRDRRARKAAEAALAAPGEDKAPKTRPRGGSAPALAVGVGQRDGKPEKKAKPREVPGSGEAPSREVPDVKPRRSVLDLSPEETRRQVLIRLWREAEDKDATSATRQQALMKIAALSQGQSAEPPSGEPASDALGMSEWHRRIQLEVDRDPSQGGGTRAVGGRLGVSQEMASRYGKGRAHPSPAVVEAARVAFGVDPAELTSPPRPPPPPTREEIIERLQLGRGFVHFWTQGPIAFPATPQQITQARVIVDGIDPVDLDIEERVHAQKLFGPVHEFPPETRRLAFVRNGRESAKSSTFAAAAIWRCLTADLAKVRAELLPTFFFFSADMETATIIMDLAGQCLEGVALNRDQKERDSTQQIIFRRPTDGRRVRLKVIPRSAGGVRGRGLPVLGAVLEESEYVDAASPVAIIKTEDVVGALMPRLTIGAAIWAISTASEAGSYAGSKWEENWGHPIDAVASLGKTVFMRNGDPDVVKRREALMLTNPTLAEREFDNSVTALADAWIPEHDLVKAIRRDNMLRRGAPTSAGLDIAYRRDRPALVVVQRQSGLLVVVAVDEIIPQPGHPLDPGDVFERFAGVIRQCGGTMAMAADAWEAESTQRGGREHGILVEQMPNQPELAHEYAADLFAKGLIKLLDDPRLLAQVRGTRRKPKARGGDGHGGYSFVRVRSPSLGHCDLSSALVAACWADRSHYGELLAPPSGGNGGGTGGFAAPTWKPIKTRFAF